MKKPSQPSTAQISRVGIPAELLPHVFDLFRQADSTLDRAQGGLGIGLSVVKSLIEMHLGRITVESRPETPGHGRDRAPPTPPRNGRGARGRHCIPHPRRPDTGYPFAHRR